VHVNAVDTYKCATLGVRARAQAHARTPTGQADARPHDRPPARTTFFARGRPRQNTVGEMLYIYSIPAAGAVLQVFGARLDNLEVVLAGRGARRKRIQALSQGCGGMEGVSGPGDSGR
jgi:hypothetical protein